MNTHRHIGQIVGVCALAAVAAACGSSGSPSPSTSTSSGAASTPAVSPTASPAPSAASSSAMAAIKTNWETFFNAQTPVPKRVSLLQDGSQFPSATLAASGLAAQATAKVLKVTNVTATQATVSYEILLGTTVALPHQTGTAVYENGSWKVGVGSFCGLLQLENAGKTSGLPAPCQSAG
jgi:hypothetical protein